MSASDQSVVHTPGPWDYSEQKGSPGHCFVAQVWDSEGESLAVLDSTIDPAVASANAKLMAMAPEMRELLQEFIDSLGDNDCIPTYRQMAAKKAALALFARVV